MKDSELLKKLEEEKTELIKQMDEIKASPKVCFLTYHKLKMKKKNLNAEIKKLKNKIIPDIIA